MSTANHTLKNIRTLIDNTSRIQLYLEETEMYMDCWRIDHLPREFDDMKVTGISLVDSLFYNPYVPGENEKDAYAIEIRLSGGENPDFGRFENDFCQVYTCRECGRKYGMRPKPSDWNSVSPIIKKQYEQELCDKCFTQWYKENDNE